MKWFQVDADTPNDPKVRAVLRQLGPEGIGGLFLLWCHIADHGTKRPGWSIDSNGRPMPEAELQEASGLAAVKFAQLVQICAEVGHFKKREWVNRSIIAIPAMVRRADTYTKRRVRTRAEVSSDKVSQSSSTRQDIPSTTSTPLTPLTGGRVTKKELRTAAEIRKQSYGRCPHEPTCPNYDVCIRTIALSRRAS